MNEERISMQERDTEELRSMIRELAGKVEDASVLRRVWAILERQYAKEI